MVEDTPSRATQVRRFFSHSDLVDHLVLRPLAHIRPNWEITWDPASDHYAPEHDSFAQMLNALIDDIADAEPPTRYHDHEDRLAEYVRDSDLKWPLRKEGNRWVGADYQSILEQGAYYDVDLLDLTLAAAGRVHAAIHHRQRHFDEMEESHRRMLGAVLSIILFRREGRS